MRVEINIFELNKSNQNHSERESLFSLIIEKESKDITVNTSIFNNIFLCGVSYKLVSYEWHFIDWSTLKMGHSSWTTLETEKYKLIRRAERKPKSYLGYWDFHWTTSICKDRLRNYNLLLKVRFNTDNSLELSFRKGAKLKKGSINLDNKTELR